MVDCVLEGIIRSVLPKEALCETDQTIGLINNGRIIYKDLDFYLEAEGFETPISLANLSTGLKAFMIIKLLIERGAITQGDVVILDEPEIHLHPQWQVAYAELIVLLQKHYQLSLVVTTYSQYFLEALELFSHKHGRQEAVNYYRSSMENNCVTMNKVDDLKLIYQAITAPPPVLEQLRQEREENEKAILPGFP
jgi:predicted ATPase